jgi:hypothetical protein
MSTTVVSVTDYLDRPFDEVCESLERVSVAPLSGALVRVGRGLARVPIETAGSTGAQADLRILAVRTGRDAITELLLVTPTVSQTEHESELRDARELLDVIARGIEADRAAPKSHALTS